MSVKVLFLERLQAGPSEETAHLGVVAEAAVFSDGTSVLRWLTQPATEVYASEKAMRKAREFTGRYGFFEPEPDTDSAKYARTAPVAETAAVMQRQLAEALERGDEITVVDAKALAQPVTWPHLSDDDSEAEAEAAEQRSQFSFPPEQPAVTRRRYRQYSAPFETGEPFRSAAEQEWNGSR